MSKYDCCPRYWRGCFSCPDFMLTEVFFCRRANVARYGVEVVPMETGREVKAGMKKNSRCWWVNGRKE